MISSVTKAMLESNASCEYEFIKREEPVASKASDNLIDAYFVLPNPHK